MLTNIEKTGHYNLYYIFKEDKEQNKIPEPKAVEIWKNILLLAKPPSNSKGLSPPIKT